MKITKEEFVLREKALKELFIEYIAEKEQLQSDLTGFKKIPPHTMEYFRLYHQTVSSMRTCFDYGESIGYKDALNDLYNSLHIRRFGD